MSRFKIVRFWNSAAVAAFVTGAIFATTAVRGDPLALVHPDRLLPQGFPSAATSADEANPSELTPNLRRQLIDYSTREAPGTIIIDTANNHLYLVLGGGKAIRYGIGVGREGFTWSGVKTPGNPLGARALYLGGTVYRIHGTNDPSTIGKHVSSGCIRIAQ
jgi:lipoprotein-anchoring transpeptidase ErfK/SrfK